jgi:hypothetical protein
MRLESWECFAGCNELLYRPLLICWYDFRPKLVGWSMQRDGEVDARKIVSKLLDIRYNA